jgi:transcriptional regulator with XRE-family HTH domain
MTVQQLVKLEKNRKRLAIDCDVSESMLSLIAHGRRRPSLDLARKLAKAKGMKLDAIALVDTGNYHVVRGAK